jgi:small-conductance mechanosensitive channel
MTWTWVKKKWVVVLAIALGAVFFTSYNACNTDSIFKQELRVLHAKTETIQSEINQKLEKIESLSVQIEAVNNKLTDLESKLKDGEAQYQALLSEIRTRLKPDAQPETFNDLQKCQEEYNILFKDFKLTIAALQKRDETFSLCLQKNEALEGKIKLLVEKNTTLEGIAAGYQAQYNAALDTLNRLKKKSVFKSAAGGFLDASALAGAGYFAREGKWKKALTTVVVRYMIKLILKV